TCDEWKADRKQSEIEVVESRQRISQQISRHKILQPPRPPKDVEKLARVTRMLGLTGNPDLRQRIIGELDGEEASDLAESYPHDEALRDQLVQTLARIPVSA